MVGPVINDGKHAVDLQLLEIVHPIEHVNSAQVEVTLILGRICLFFKDVDDVAALLVIEGIHVKELY